VISASLQACGVAFPFAISTSIYRSSVTISSDWCKKTPSKSSLCHRKQAAETTRLCRFCFGAEDAAKQIHRITILIPLVVGACVVACTIFIHGLAVIATVSFVRRENNRGLTGRSFWIDLAVVAQAMFFALVAHLAEIALWAVLFVICGEFSEFGTAYYHSAVNYTTLGYGDLIMSPSWRLLGPLEAADGCFMFGVSTAIVFAVVQMLIHRRFADLKG
jgi:hypothetical protein